MIWISELKISRHKIKHFLNQNYPLHENEVYEVLKRIPFNETPELIKNIDFDDFKINDLIISWEIDVSKQNKCHGLINIKTPSIKLDVKYLTMDDEFLFYIESVL